MRIAGLFLVLTVCLLTVPADAKWRSELYLFRYANTVTDELRLTYNQFKDFLRNNVPRLASELPNVPPAAYLELNTDREERYDLVRSLSAIRTNWANLGALAFLTGHIAVIESDHYTRTTFHWGHLHGPYPSESIEVSLPVTGIAYESTYHSHAVAILYALAHELGQKCEQRHNAIQLLSEAHKRAQAVEHAFADGEVQIRDIIEDAIAALRGPCDT